MRWLTSSIGDPAAQDLATFEAMLDGQIDPARAFHEIAWSGGWPIETAAGFIVAVQDPRQMSVAYERDGWTVRPMERRGDVQFATIGPRGAGKYKLVTHTGRGREWIGDPNARCYGYDDYGEYSLTRPVGERIEWFPGMTDGNVAPRDLRVWVPAQRATHHLYMHDGQNLFDPQAMWGGWRTQETVGQRTLVIGIDNSGKDRLHDYTHTLDEIGESRMGGGADAYADFVQKTVRPFIQRRYGAPRKVGLLGSSLGGLASMNIALKYPNAYDFVGAMSGTFGWGAFGDENGDTMPKRWEGVRHRRTTFYLDSGGSPGGRDNYDSTKTMAETLAASGYEWGRDLWHWHEPDALHNELAWADRLHRPIGIFERM